MHKFVLVTLDLEGMLGSLANSIRDAVYVDLEKLNWRKVKLITTVWWIGLPNPADPKSIQEYVQRTLNTVTQRHKVPKYRAVLMSSDADGWAINV